jgi:heat-inducible transcriptional repressor
VAEVLTERQLEIVLAVVYEYIRSGIPIGSRTIAKRYLKGCSAATVRNEMADLEEMDYLYQPHTSAGRIPTPRAFRIYVDAILQRQRTRPKTRPEWLRELRERRDDVQSALRYSTKLLGDLTHCVSVAALGPAQEAVLQKVEFIRVAERSVLIIVVLRGGLIHHKMATLPYDMTQDSLDELSRRVNIVAQDKSWQEVRNVLQRYVLEELEAYTDNCRKALEEMNGMLGENSYQYFTGGRYNVLGLPEFSDLSRLQTMMALLEEDSSIAQLVKRCSPDSGLSVIIGDENPVTQMSDCSVLMASSTNEGRKTILGLIGPVRMDYEYAISVLESLLGGLSMNGNSGEGKGGSPNGSREKG